MTFKADRSDKEIKALMEAQGMKPDKHNWMYSFMNRTLSSYPLSDTASYIKTDIYLVAYCKQCDQTMSVLVPTSAGGAVRLSRVGVPKLGCDWNESAETSS